MTEVLLEPAPGVPVRRRSWRLLAAAAVVLAAVVGAGVWVRWLYTPNVFGAAGGYGLEMHRTVGATVYFAGDGGF